MLIIIGSGNTEAGPHISIKPRSLHQCLAASFLKNSITNADKKKIWEEITQKINVAGYGYERSPEEVRNKWRDFASVTKRRAAACKREANKTDGGINSVPPLTTEEEKVLAILGPEALEGILGGIDFRPPTSGPLQSGPSTSGLLQPGLSKSPKGPFLLLSSPDPPPSEFSDTEGDAEVRQLIGIIDGTLIPVSSPVVNEPLYICRKGYPAINVQIVCDYQGMFTDIVAKWPRSTHDSFVWANSAVCQVSEEGGFGDSWLLGESGYPLRPYLLTHVQHPAKSSQVKFICTALFTIQKALQFIFWCDE
uniref:Uncharacterized protein n=1 Tax=Sinocyclocheilus grahami TaxID=75366 RepID=A0A672MID1_SINGR